jgi:hypothetical protein
VSEQQPTQPALTPFQHTARAANPAMLVHLYRQAASAVLRVGVNDSTFADHVRMDVLTKELVRRDLRELASDLNDEWMARSGLARLSGRQPVAAILAAELAEIRVRISSHIRGASA